MRGGSHRPRRPGAWHGEGLDSGFDDTTALARPVPTRTLHAPACETEPPLWGATLARPLDEGGVDWQEWRNEPEDAVRADETQEQCSVLATGARAQSRNA